MFKVPSYELGNCTIIKPVNYINLYNSLKVFIDKMGHHKKQVGLRYANDFEGLGNLLDKEYNPKGYTDIDFDRWIDNTEVMQEIANDLKIRKRGRVRILLMTRQTCYTYHSDLDSYRVHIPLVTNDKCFMVIDGECWHLPLGNAYLVNVGLMHTAVNASTENRIHIVSSGPPYENIT